jgi:DNA-binding NtrC family response regulator
MAAERILVVEDDELTRGLLVKALARDGYRVEESTDGEAALARLANGSDEIDIVVSDVQMPRRSGMELVAELARSHPEVPVVLLTAYADPSAAMDAIALGAVDYLAKPVDVMALRATVRGALERRRLKRENAALREEVSGRRALVGTSPPMLALYKQIAQVAATDATVLVTGESGAGKELVARTLHERSRRAAGPFIAVSCGALAESVLESELFGHEKGAFTGAVGMRRGLFEEAAGGTLFLDEIGEVTPKMQTQLLRVLQEHEIRRVGGSATVPVDVRLVAATHRDLQAEVAAGRMRADLFYRLNVVALRVPPLRERGEDVVHLARYFLARQAASLRRPTPDVSPEVVAALRAYAWPGNVRELENAIAHAVALCQRGVLVRGDLPATVSGEAPLGGAIDEGWPTLDELERRYIDRVLAHTGGNKTAAAKILDVDRRTLQRLFAKIPDGNGGS